MPYKKHPDEKNIIEKPLKVIGDGLIIEDYIKNT